MDIFKGQNLLEFSDRFKTDEDCKKYLAENKWQDGFKCVKNGHKSANTKRLLSHLQYIFAPRINNFQHFI